MTVIPIITMFLPKMVTIITANIAPIKLPVACSDIVFIERYILGCIAKIALIPATDFKPTLSGKKEAIKRARMIAIPVLSIRAPNFKYNAPLNNKFIV